MQIFALLALPAIGVLASIGNTGCGADVSVVCTKQGKPSITVTRSDIKSPNPANVGGCQNRGTTDSGAKYTANVDIDFATEVNKITFCTVSYADYDCSCSS